MSIEFQDIPSLWTGVVRFLGDVSWLFNQNRSTVGQVKVFELKRAVINTNFSLERLIAVLINNYYWRKKIDENFQCFRGISVKIYLNGKQRKALLSDGPICASGKKIKTSRGKVLVRLLTSNFIILRLMVFSWTSQFMSWHGFP